MPRDRRVNVEKRVEKCIFFSAFFFCNRRGGGRGEKREGRIGEFDVNNKWRFFMLEYGSECLLNVERTTCCTTGAVDRWGKSGFQREEGEA